uniref:Helicase C-terminal domain-containing protein n=2 Tax=Lotharella globosa TaxID=91324 RepID=A0A7S3YR85_9EUKA
MQVMQNRSSLFSAMHVLLKLCNHPDLLLLRPVDPNKPNGKKCPPPDLEDYGNPERSGKMKVLREILTTWKAQKHKFLVFSQTRQVLDLIEGMIRSQLGINYARIDGSTPVQSRQPLIDRFNMDDDLECMLLTTRAAGIGVNLTGANRVVLFDPHWNPSNDNQAKERSYRIGQKRDVKVYRLITRGTIEEKVYHRQIHKEFLTSKILANPNQKRFFSRGDLKDLFVCPPLPSDIASQKTETARIFEPERLNPPKLQKNVDDNKSDEADILHLVMGGAGWAHSALSHDEILRASKAETRSNRDKAEKRVRGAMERLQDSGRRRRRHRSTDLDGLGNVAGQGETSGPMSSALLIQRIQDRKEQESRAASYNSNTSNPGRDGTAYTVRGGDFGRSRANGNVDRMYLQLRQFLRCYPQGVKTQKLIERFGHSIESKADQKLFKKTLRDLAECSNGTWIMKKTKQLKVSEMPQE